MQPQPKENTFMSRRDTIIIALLVNASLLALLFMLAINTEDDDKVADNPEISTTIVENQKSFQPPSVATPIILSETNAADEVDSFLKDLASDPAVVKSSAPAELKMDDIQLVEVTVKRGDALEKIARNSGTTVEAIKKANNLPSTKLTIGQVLKVPVSKKNTPKETVVTQSKPTPKPIAAATPKESEKKVTSAATDVQYYTIKSGDSPWKIAKQLNVNYEELLRLNGLDEEKARNLKIGDKIRVH
jgi:peptidoglycan DL-endopeptidase LytF